MVDKSLGNDLEKKVFVFSFSAFVLAGLYFGVYNLSGAVIGLSRISVQFIGAVLFVGGLIGLYFSLRGKFLHK